MKQLASLGIALIVCACSSGGAGGGGGGAPTSLADGGVASGSSGSSAGKPVGATAVQCSAPSDCGNWVCECSAGAPVNASNCTNGYCLDAERSCPKACAGFDETWTGRASGGPSSKTTSTASSPSCTSHAECSPVTCDCTDGFRTMPLSVSPKCKEGACVAKSLACTDACDSQGMSWFSE